MIDVRPSSKHEVNRLIREWHSHHDPVRALRFALVALDGDVAARPIIGGVVVENPTAPALQDGRTFEVTRLCTNHHQNAASALLGASTRAASAMGFWLGVSYTRQDEPGTCYLAAGWVKTAEVAADAHDHGNRRGRWLPGLYEPSTEIVARYRWEWRPHAHIRAFALLLPRLMRWAAREAVPIRRKEDQHGDLLPLRPAVDPR